MVSWSTIVLAVALPVVVLGHSWIACTKYTGDIFQEGGYDANKCQGWIRDWINRGARGNGFGGDFNQFNTFDFRGGRNPNQPVCHGRRGEPYPPQFRSATYRAGERVRLVWPAKNHGGPGNGRCTDNHPDPQDKVFMYCDGREPDINELRRGNSNMIADLKANGGRGFKNCVNFCANTDRAACQGDFTVPSNARGRCTFVWFWELNAGEFYTNCWEADITGGDGAPAPAPGSDPQPQPQPSPSPQPPQGGNCSPRWGQCGGQNWGGARCCADGTSCQVQNIWYHQCL